MTYKLPGLALISLGFLSAANAAFDVRVSVINNAASDGVYFTPVWSAFHDGSFDLFDSGSAASAGLAELAETGSPATLNTEFGTAGGRLATSLASASGIGPGLFDPGRSASFDITLDETNNRYFSFASMLLPSNDAFIGNGDPLANELFDAMGTFNGPLTITLFGSNVYDAGSELNDTFGAPFSMIGGTSTDTNVGVSIHAGLDNFIGSQLGNGDVLGQAFTDMTPIATITVTAVPEPSAYAMISGLLVLAFVGARRRVR
ncbi:MAG: spondin domain-containing protein [Opitutaceae bacterium]